MDNMDKLTRLKIAYRAQAESHEAQAQRLRERIAAIEELEADAEKLPEPELGKFAHEFPPS